MSSWVAGYDMVTTEAATVPESGWYRILSSTAVATIAIKQTAAQDYQTAWTTTVGQALDIRLSANDLIMATFAAGNTTIRRLLEPTR